MSILDGWRHCPRCASPLTRRDGAVACEVCGFVHYAHSSPAVSALVEDAQGRLLLARRAHEPDAGRWDTPGGFIDEGEHPLDALRRELIEETGLTVEPGAFVGAHIDTYGDGPDASPVLNLVWKASVISGEPEPADDVSELRWFEHDGLPVEDEVAFRWLVPVLQAWAQNRA